jgi:hypothetical protein
MRVDKLALTETLHDVVLGLVIALPISFLVLNICRDLGFSLLATSVTQTTIFTLIAIIRKYYVRVYFKNLSKNQ